MSKSWYAGIGQKVVRDKVVTSGYGRSARGQRYVMAFVETECDPLDKASVKSAKQLGMKEIFEKLDN